MSPQEKDNVDQSYEYSYKKNFRTALPQFLAVSVKNLLLLSKYYFSDTTKKKDITVVGSILVHIYIDIYN